MSAADLERLVGRATIDADFRKELIADADSAIKSSGLSLDADEIDRVKQAVSSGKSGVTDQLDKLGAGFW